MKMDAGLQMLDKYLFAVRLIQFRRDGSTIEKFPNSPIPQFKIQQFNKYETQP